MNRFYALIVLLLLAAAVAFNHDQVAEGQVQGSDRRGVQQQGSDQRGSVQQGSDQRGSAPKQQQAPFEDRFWNYLTRGKVPYRRWNSWPGKTEMYAGQSPHGAFLRMYANSKAVQNTNKPGDGSVIVKENYADDKKTLTSVTVMYKTKGYDPQHGDWYWVKYSPDGSVARTPPNKGSQLIKGRFASCIQCHASADGGDFVYAND
ncbi:MAG: cytochrome P460 family protein [Pirellulales bacterium]